MFVILKSCVISQTPILGSWIVLFKFTNKLLLIFPIFLSFSIFLPSWAPRCTMSSKGYHYILVSEDYWKLLWFCVLLVPTIPNWPGLLHYKFSVEIISLPDPIPGTEILEVENIVRHAAPCWVQFSFHKGRVPGSRQHVPFPWTQSGWNFPKRLFVIFPLVLDKIFVHLVNFRYNKILHELVQVVVGS